MARWPCAPISLLPVLSQVLSACAIPFVYLLLENANLHHLSLLKVVINYVSHLTW